MKIFKKIGFAACLALILSLVAFQAFAPLAVRAADQPATPKLTVSTNFPALTGSASSTFTFDVDLLYSGATDARYFNLTVKGPVQYTLKIIQTSGGSNEISSIKLDPANTYPDTVRVTAAPNAVQPPTPGKYTFTFAASSGDQAQTIDLTATVTATYGISLQTPDGVLSTRATASKDNYFTIAVINTGTAVVNNISFISLISGSPKDWNITFDPVKIDSLAVGGVREVKVDIKPAPKTISGDYLITMAASSDAQAVQSSMDVRVTVETANILSILGIIVVVIVVLGLIGMFFYLGRR
jgi:uncharacterized membrane protein